MWKNKPQDSADVAGACSAAKIVVGGKGGIRFVRNWAKSDVPAKWGLSC